MEKRNALFLLILISIAALISFYFDKNIVVFFENLRNSYLNEFFLGITFLSAEIIVLFFLTSLFLWSEHKRKWIFPLWFTLGLSALISFLLKFSIQRLRPYQAEIVSTLPVLQEAGHLAWNFSFPSFQAMLGFCAVPILSKEFPRFRYVWIAFAVLIAVSRVYFGVHYMSDVIVGGTVGYIIGSLVIKHEKENKLWERLYKKIFRKN